MEEALCVDGQWITQPFTKAPLAAVKIILGKLCTPVFG